MELLLMRSSAAKGIKKKYRHEYEHMKRLLLKAAKKEMHSELWAGDESGSRAYSTEEPCQTRRVVLRLPTFWPGSQPCSLLHSPGQSFSTRVFLL